MDEIDADLLLRAYASGYFPMARSADEPELYWFDPELRGLLPLEGFHLSQRLRRTVRSGHFRVSVDTAFKDVMLACAANSRPGRDTTSINDRILQLYAELHELGYAHSVECWLDGRLVGGLYGVAIGAAFFGESMFSLETDASKVALVYLVARLRAGGYTLLDTQWVTEHLTQFGAFEVPRLQYRKILRQAITTRGQFNLLAEDTSCARIVELCTGQPRPSEKSRAEGIDGP